MNKLTSKYYRFQYTDSNCLYYLKDARIKTINGNIGILASFSVDGKIPWCSNGFFPFAKCRKFYAIKRIK